MPPHIRDPLAVARPQWVQPFVAGEMMMADGGMSMAAPKGSEPVAAGPMGVPSTCAPTLRADAQVSLDWLQSLPTSFKMGMLRTPCALLPADLVLLPVGCRSCMDRQVRALMLVSAVAMGERLWNAQSFPAWMLRQRTSRAARTVADKGHTLVACCKNAVSANSFGAEDHASYAR